MGDIRGNWTQVEVNMDIMLEKNRDEYELFLDVELWLDENIDGEYLLLPYIQHFIESHNENPMSCYFKDDTDAAAFKLTWT